MSSSNYPGLSVVVLVSLLLMAPSGWAKKYRFVDTLAKEEIVLDLPLKPSQDEGERIIHDIRFARSMEMLSPDKPYVDLVKVVVGGRVRLIKLPQKWINKINSYRDRQRQLRPRRVFNENARVTLFWLFWLAPLCGILVLIKKLASSYSHKTLVKGVVAILIVGAVLFGLIQIVNHVLTGISYEGR